MQADVKNAERLASFEAGEKELFQFNEAYARHYPEIAGRIVAHNGRLTGGESELPAGSMAADLVVANDQLVGLADAQNLPVVDQIVGYDFDAAFPTLLKNLLPVGNGLLGFVLAAIFGAVVSSLASMLNSASTIFTMDIYYKLRRAASQYELVSVGRICTIVFVLIALWIAPNLESPRFGNIFNYIQEFQGFISPGVLAIFLFGLLVHKAPRSVGTVGLVLNPILYGGLKWFAPQIAFLDRMAICFGILLVVLTAMTRLWPLEKPVELPVNASMDLTSSTSAKFFGGLVVLLALALYVLFF